MADHRVPVTEMANVLRVLYVDDEPDLLRIGKLFLERDGAFTVDTLTSASEALTLLNSQQYDAIISDFQMPEIDGITFLKQLKASGNTTPFIIFTGRGREEVVIEALNEGADFYIQKGGEPRAQFAELANKIRYAITRRQVEEDLSESQKQTAEIIDFLPDATFAISTDGVVIAWNRAMEIMTGVHKKKILNKGNYEYSLPFYGKRRPILIDLVLSPDEITSGKYPFILKEGDKIASEIFIPHFHDNRGAYLWFTASPLYKSQGVLSGAIESIRDITEQKRAEEELAESEMRYRNIVEDQTEFITRFLPEGTHIFVNDAYCRYFGVAREQIIGHRFKPVIHPADRKAVASFFASLTLVNPVGYIDHRIIMPGGDIRWQRWSDRAIFDAGGNVVQYQSVGRDITNQKLAEEELCKKNEELQASYEQIAAAEEELRANLETMTGQELELRESEGKFRTLFENAGDAIFIMDHTVFLDCNKRTNEIFRSTRDEIIGHSPSEFSPEHQPDGQLSAEKSATHIDAAFLGENQFFEWVHVRKDGTPFNTEVNLNRVMLRGTCYLQAIVRDITDRKLAEKNLVAALKRTIDQQAAVGTISLSPLHLYGDVQGLAASLTKISSGVLGVERASVWLFNSTGEELQCIDLFEVSLDRHSSGFVLKRHEYVNEFDALRNVKYIDAHDPLTDPRTAGYVESYLIPNRITSMLDAVVRVSGQDLGLLCFEHVDRPHHWESDEIAFACQLADQVAITMLNRDRKQAENAIRESEEKFRLIVENSHDIIYTLTAEGEFMFISPSWTVLLGHPVSFVTGQPFHHFVHPDDIPGCMVFLRSVIEKGQRQASIEYRVRHANGTWYWNTSSAVPIKDEAGTIIGFYGIARDITERKKAEKILLDVIDKNPMSIQIVDRNGYVLKVNPAHTRLFGAVPPSDYTIFDDAQLKQQGYAGLIDRAKTGEVVTFPEIYYNVHNVDPEFPDVPVWIRMVIFPINDHDGNPERFVTMHDDITERKCAEEALQRQSVSLSILEGVISTANETGDLPHLLERILDESLRLLDFDAGGIYLVDRSTRTAHIVYFKNLPAEFLDKVRTVPIDTPPYDSLFIKNEPIITDLYEQIAPDHSKNYGFSSMASIPLLSKGVAIGALNIASFRRHVISLLEKQVLTSISSELGSAIERMTAEEEEKKTAKNLATLFNSIDDMVFVLDMEGRILVVNDTVQKRLSYTSEELIGMDVLQLHVPELRDEALHNVQGMITGTIDSCPVPVLTKDGTRIEVETKVTRGWWNGNEVLIGVSRDISGRKLAEEAIRESEEKYRGLFAAESDGIVVVNRETGIIIDCNDAFPPMHGYCKDEVIGMPVSAASAEPGALDATIKAGAGHIPVRYHKRKDGSLFPVEITVNVMSLQGHEVIIAAVRDITERQQAEDALRQASKKLNLLSSITRHDINNQLTVLMGYLTILKNKQPDATHNEYFLKVSTAAERISAMIRFTKEYEEIGVHAPAWQDCRTLVNNAAKQAPLGKINVTNDLSAGIEVSADPLIVKVFYNLMDNAVRYGGKITTIRFSALERDGNEVIVCEDDGVGVAAAEKEKIFEPGFGKNTGLGLALSREVLDITGITIEETGEPGKGARFEMTVPKDAWRFIEKDGKKPT